MVGFRDMCLPLPASAADPFLLDLCRRCLHRSPQQRPTFTDIVSQLDQNYGPPAWASHAQPLLPPTLRLPLPAAAAAAARASTGRQGLAPGADGAAAGAAPALPGKGSAAAAALQAEAPHGSEPWEAPNGVADAAGGHGSVKPTLEQQQQQRLRGNLADVREAAAAAAAAVAAWAKEQQHSQQEQEQQSNAAAAPTAAAPAKLFSPFGGAALPPWSVDSVDSLTPAAPQAPDSLAGSGAGAAAAAAAAAAPPVSQARLFRQASSSDTSSSGCSAERQGAAAVPGDSMAVSTQPGSASSASLLLQMQAAKQAGVSGATADADVAVCPPASVTGVTGAPAAARQLESELGLGSSAFQQEQQQQQQPGSSPQPTAGGVSSPVRAASPASSDSSLLGLSSRDSSPFEQVQFVGGNHVYTTPVKIGTPLNHRDDPAAKQQRQQSDAAPPAPGAAGSPAPAAAETATTQASAAAAGPFGALAHEPLSSGTDSSTEPAYAHAAQQGQGVCQVCAPHDTRLGSAGGRSTPLSAGSAEQHAGVAGHHHAATAAGASAEAGAPAAAAAVAPGRAGSQHICWDLPVLRNGPASAPCAPGYMLPEQTAAHAWLDDTGSFNHSITAVSAGSKLPSDASMRRTFWPSMTATDASAHSLTGLAGLGAGSERPGGAGSSRNSSRRSSSSSLGDGSSNGPSAVGSSSSGGTGAGVGGRPTAAPASGNGSNQGQAVQGAAVEAADGNADRAGQAALAAGAPHQGAAEPLPSHTLQHQEPPLQLQQPAQQLSQQQQQQQQQLSSSQQVYQVWPVLAGPGNVLGNGQQWQQAPALLLEASGVSYRPNGASEGTQHSSRWDTATSPAGLSQPKPTTQQQQQQQQQVFGCSKTPAPPGSLRSLGSGQHSSVGHSRSTSFQRKGRFMVSTMTPEPPGVDEGPSGGVSPAAGAAGSPANRLAAASGLTSSLHMMSACNGLQSPSSWLLGAGMQPGWPLLGSSVSAPPPNVDLVSAQQQHQLMMQQHERGLTMQMSAPASLGGLASQPGTPATTPTGAASEAAAPWHTPRLQACDSADLQFSLQVSDPACRRLAGKGYWGSGIMREPSAALLDSSSGSRSLRGSHEGFEESGGSRPLQQQEKPFSNIRSNAAWAAMLQSVSSSSGSSTGLCYRSGRFHVTVEQLQAWQQRQAQLQQQHAHLPHKSNSTGALLAAAGLAVAEQSPSAAAVHTASTDTRAVAPQAQQQQQQQARPLHPSASCSSLQHQPLQQPQGQGQQGPGMPAGQQAKQQRGKATPAGPAAGLMPAGPTHTDEHGTDIRSYCDVKSSSTGSSIQSGSSSSTAQGAQTAAPAAAMTSSSSASCLRLKAATAAKAAAAGSLAHPAPPGPGRPPVIPSGAACKTPSPAATPHTLSPRLQRAKSRDYCKGRFQVHESPVVGHGRGQDHRNGPATSGPSHSICMGQLQQLQQQAQQSLQSLSEQEPLLQPRASSPPDLEASPGSTTLAVVGTQDSVGREGGVQLPDVSSSPGLVGSVGPHARSTASHSSSGGGVSDAGSGSAASCTPTAAADDASAAGAGAAASAAAMAAVVQQRGRFTVRQESRPGSRPGSAQGSKAASPRGTQQHPACDRLSKLGSK